jgi:hypothetical protein
MSTCPPLAPWVESQFDTACDVLESILEEIERDDSGAKDCKSEALKFPKFAELESLYACMCSGSDKEQIRSLFRGLRYKVINFLHYQKLRCFWAHEWNKAFHESREFCRYTRFVPLAKKFEEICRQKSVYIYEETIALARYGETTDQCGKIEEYITNEDRHLKLIQDTLAREYQDEADKRMTADFEETKQALKCRRLYILSFWTGVHESKFRDWFDKLWPFMNEHKLWNFPTPSQYKKKKTVSGNTWFVCRCKLHSPRKTAAAGAVRAAIKKLRLKKLRPRAWPRRRDGDRNVWRQEFRVSSDDDV